MRIGDLAARTGVSVQTIRFYERRGLLKKTHRQASGYRSFSESHIHQVRFIKRSQRLGYTLLEIRRLIELKERHPHNAAEARTIVETKIRNLEEKILALQQMRDELIDVARECGCSDGEPVCRFLESVEFSSGRDLPREEALTGFDCSQFEMSEMEEPCTKEQR